MKLLNEIVKSGILGTDNYCINNFEYLNDFHEKIVSKKFDKEDAFLKTAFASFIYMEVGRESETSNIDIANCNSEIYITAPKVINDKLEFSLNKNDEMLFNFILHLLIKNHLIVDCRLIPTLLEKAKNSKISLPELVKITGERGKWLCKLNPEWENLTKTIALEEDIWQTGSLESRKKYLKNLRISNPALAIELLEDCIKKEKADTRFDFISILEINLSINDEQFLIDKLKDKSEKVKDKVIYFLKRIKGSEINSLLNEFIKSTISISSNKIEFEKNIFQKAKILYHKIAVISYQEVLFNESIEKLAKVDDFFWYAEILPYVDSINLSTHLNISSSELINLLLRHPKSEDLIPSFIQNAINNNDVLWAKRLLNHQNVSDIKLLRIIPKQEKENFYKQFIINNINALIEELCDENYSEISFNLAENIFNYMEKHPFQITNYKKLSYFFPVEMIVVIQNYLSYTSGDYQKKHFIKQISEIMDNLKMKNSLLKNIHL